MESVRWELRSSPAETLSIHLTIAMSALPNGLATVADSETMRLGLFSVALSWQSKLLGRSPQFHAQALSLLLF